MNINEVDFAPLLNKVERPVEPYMAFGMLGKNYTNRRETVVPEIAVFKLLGSLRKPSQALDYIRKGYKLLEYRVPVGNPEYAELDATLKAFVGKDPAQAAALEADLKEANKKITELEARVAAEKEKNKKNGN